MTNLRKPPERGELVLEEPFRIEFYRQEPARLIVWGPPDKLKGDPHGYSCKQAIVAPPLHETIVKALGELAKACGCDKTDADLTRHLGARLVYVESRHFQWIRALHGFGKVKA